MNKFLAKLLGLWESRFSKLLSRYHKYYIEAMMDYKSSSTATDIMKYFNTKVFKNEKLSAETYKETKRFIELVMLGAGPEYLKQIDNDALFNNLFNRKTRRDIDKQAKAAAKMIKGTNERKVRAILIKLGTGKIDKDQAIKKLKYMKGFDLSRAKVIVSTEGGAAVSLAQHEAMLQSKVAVGSVWKHHPSKNPRHTHTKMDGTFALKGQRFVVDGHECYYPRSHELPADHRINCKCTLSVVIDKKKI